MTNLRRENIYKRHRSQLTPAQRRRMRHKANQAEAQERRAAAKAAQ